MDFDRQAVDEQLVACENADSLVICIGIDVLAVWIHHRIVLDEFFEVLREENIGTELDGAFTTQTLVCIDAEMKKRLLPAADDLAFADARAKDEVEFYRLAEIFGGRRIAEPVFGFVIQVAIDTEVDCVGVDSGVWRFHPAVRKMGKHETGLDSETPDEVFLLVVEHEQVAAHELRTEGVVLVIGFLVVGVGRHPDSLREPKNQMPI